MKCLSLWNPWAGLFVHGKKRVETRGWELKHRGPLLIHAAKKWTTDLYNLCRTEPFLGALADCGFSIAIPTGRGKIRHPRGMPFGAIIGRVEVVEVYPTRRVKVDDGVLAGAVQMPTSPPWLAINSTESEFGDYAPGRFAVFCTGFEAFAEPIPCRGRQSLFDAPEDVMKKLAART